MDIEKSQQDMKWSYLGGGTGALVSGLVWLTTGLLANYASQLTSILVFFFGGMLIHPLGLLLAKLFKRPGKHQQNNPLAKLAMESTAMLFVGLFMAYIVFQIKPVWFFPTMSMMIGLRYLIFQSLYGMKLYWLFGLLLIIAGMICVITNQAFQIAAIAGGLIELLFALIIIQSERNPGAIEV